MTKLLAVMCLVTGCTDGIGHGTIAVDDVSIGAASAWARPIGVTHDRVDYMGWTIQFSRANPGIGCDVAPDLATLASVNIITPEVDSDPSTGHAPFSTLAVGDVPVLVGFPESFTAPFALATLDGAQGDMTDGTVTITSFGDSIDGTFLADVEGGDVSGTFAATRCFD
jgi:hypothetical protein